MKAINPRTGEADYDFHAHSAGEIASEAARLRAMQPEWEARGVDYRASMLNKFADAVERHADAIASALAVDTGRRTIARVEVEGMVRNCRARAARAVQLFAELPHEATPAATPGIEIAARFSAYPLFGAIAPWNFPMLLTHTDAVSALAVGSAALLKPSEVTPRFVEPLREALAEVSELPIAYIMGGAETGQALVENVDYVCFTGSTATGRKVAEAAARALIPANLELGGKDPLIITASADPEWAAKIALRSSMISTGQACQSIERVYVAREISEPFLATLVEQANLVELNYPDIGKGHIGPFIFPPQAAKVAEQVAAAFQAGAKVLTGGEVEVLGGGSYMRPTILTDVTPDMAVMREETFGPVLAVVVFDDIEDAIAQANDTSYGLSAGVLAGSLEEAAAIGERLDAGAISLQDGGLTTVTTEATNHSRKTSGLGPSRMGDEGILRFLRRQALIRQTSQAAGIEVFAEHAANG